MCSICSEREIDCALRRGHENRDEVAHKFGRSDIPNQVLTYCTPTLTRSGDIAEHTIARTLAAAEARLLLSHV